MREFGRSFAKDENALRFEHFQMVELGYGCHVIDLNFVLVRFRREKIQLEFMQGHKKSRLPVIFRGRVEFKSGFIST